MGLGGVDQLLALLLLDLPAGDVQRQCRRGDLAVVGDPDRGVPADVLDLLGLREEAIHALLHVRAVDAPGCLPDRVDLLAGVPVEALLGQVAGGLRFGVGRVVVGLELPGERGADPDDQDCGDDPAEEHAATATAGEFCEAS
jgi:hypothetical protein